MRSDPPGPRFDHTTVLLDETVRSLPLRSDGVYADVTLGGAGHTRALLEATSPRGRVLGLDRDPNALEVVRERLDEHGDRVSLHHAAFADLPGVLEAAGVQGLDGMIADLGCSSPQLDQEQRGFSFNKAGPLDMRMDTSSGETLAELLGRTDQTELADAIFHYGGERRSRPIARSIKRALEKGELKDTGDLRRAVVRVTGPRRSGGVDPATRTFQGLRIAVNRELEQLRGLLQSLPEVLNDGGVAAIISFHSGEDRMVKHGFRDEPRLEVFTRKPITASEEERAVNPRSRSAKLRVARRIPRAQDVVGGGL